MEAFRQASFGTFAKAVVTLFGFVTTIQARAINIYYIYIILYILYII